MAIDGSNDDKLRLEGMDSFAFTDDDGLWEGDDSKERSESEAWNVKIVSTDDLMADDDDDIPSDDADGEDEGENRSDLGDDGSVGSESEPEEAVVDQGDADTDVDPDEEMEFNFPGFVVMDNQDKSDVEFTMNLIGRWVGYNVQVCQ